MAAVPRRVIVEVLAARAVIPNVTTYVRKVGTLANGQTLNPPTISSNDLRVKPYIVLYPSPGIPGPDERLGGDRVGLGETFQLSCVVGEEKAIDLLIDAVTSRFDEWRPVLPAPYDTLPIGRTRLLNDVMPRPDEDEKPPRYWVPLVYGLVVNN